MRCTRSLVLDFYLSLKFGLSSLRGLGPFEEESQIVALEMSRIRFTSSNFIFSLYLPILKVSCV